MKLNCKKLSELISVIDNKNKNEKFTELLGININKEFIKSVANTVGTDLAKYKVIENECFACNLMHVGRDKKIPMALYKGKGAIVSPAYYVFNIKNRDEILPEYLELYFGKEEFDKKMYFLSQNGIRGNLDWKDFSNEVIEYPSLEMQQKIIKINNLINKSIITNNQINDNLFKLINRLLNKIISNTCEKGIVEELANVQGGFAFKSNDFIDVETKNKIIKIKNINNGLLDVENTQYIEESIANNIDNRFELNNGEVVIALTGASLGNTAFIYNTDTYKYFLNQRVGVLRPKETKYTYYLKALFLSDKFRNLLSAKGYGSAQPNISTSDIEKVEIYIPRETELEIFNKEVEILYKNIIKNCDKNVSLKKLKNILIPKLLSGEIDISKIRI